VVQVLIAAPPWFVLLHEASPLSFPKTRWGFDAREARVTTMTA